MKLSPSEQKKQELYRDARITGEYSKIWKSVGKCVFCDLDEKYVFYEENGIVMTVAVFAYIDGHMMIIPRRHVKSVKELTPAEWETMRKFMYIAKKTIREVHGIKGMQIVQKDGAEAQSTVEHLHFHCVPFDEPDLNVWNYRKLKNTPIENAENYKQMKSSIAQLSKRFSEKYTAHDALQHDKKLVYREALKQSLTRKKASAAHKTAKVGASIIAGNTVISMCNANLSEGPMEFVAADGHWVSPPTVSHAEERCISEASKKGVSLQGATLIVTLSPCMLCSRLIINSGIKELHYIDDWWDTKALDFLREHDVKVKKIPLLKLNTSKKA